MSDRIPTELTPERGREEMRALIAILTAGADMLPLMDKDGQLYPPRITPEQYAAIVGPIINDTWPIDPLECLPALTALSLRMATWVAQAEGLDSVRAVLVRLAAEIEPPNLNQG
jgi:hypothetical protein